MSCRADPCDNWPLLVETNGIGRSECARETLLYIASCWRALADEEERRSQPDRPEKKPS